MNSLVHKHSENLAGIFALMIALTSEVSGMPTISADGTYATLPYLKAGANWAVLEFTDDSAVFKGNPKREGAGINYKPTLSLKFPKLDSDLSLFIDTYAQAAFVLVVHDRNGYTYIIGTKDRPVRMNVKDLETGDKIGDTNGVAIELFAYSTYPFRVVSVVPYTGSDYVEGVYVEGDYVF